MNTVLVQEIEKYNALIKIIKDSLYEVKRALEGYTTMSEDLEKLADSLYNQQVPEAWGRYLLISQTLAFLGAGLEPTSGLFQELGRQRKASLFIGSVGSLSRKLSSQEQGRTTQGRPVFR